jgi:hypothetical protein
MHLTPPFSGPDYRTTSAGFLSQGVFLYLPGKNPNDFYICIGRVPAKMIRAVFTTLHFLRYLGTGPIS